MFPPKKPDQLIGPAAMLAYGLKKCPACEFYAFHQIDLDSHMKTHWRTTNNGEGEWMPSSLDSKLAQVLRSVGVMIQNSYKYSLIHNGQTIYRKKAT